MASSWTQLKTDYVDISWSGDKIYNITENSDGTYGIEDETDYTNTEDSFFGAADANAINTAVNYIMAALENGTNLYKVFTEYFTTQQNLFEEEVESIEDELQSAFETWFESIKDQLSEDAAGNLQLEIDTINSQLNGLTFILDDVDGGLNIVI